MTRFAQMTKNLSCETFLKKLPKRQKQKYITIKYKNITCLLISYTKALPIRRQNSTNRSCLQKDKKSVRETIARKSEKNQKNAKYYFEIN